MNAQPPDHSSGSGTPESASQEPARPASAPVIAHQPGPSSSESAGAPAGQAAVPPSPGEVPRPRTRWVAAAAAALGVALFAVPLLRGPNDDFSSGGTCATKEGIANLDFTLKDASGADVRLSKYKGKVVLLNFWATWCGPCKLEIPEFVEAYDHYRDRGFVILGVLSEDDPSTEELRTFTNEFRMNYPVFRAHEGLETAFGPLFALPTTFLVDRQGAICMKHMGPVTKEMLEREIRGLL